MYVGLKQPRGDGERYVTPARAAAKETRNHLAPVVRRLDNAIYRMNRYPADNTIYRITLSTG